LILALIAVAVAATVVGSAAATTTPSPATADFGAAQDRATFTGPGSRVAAEIASISRRFGTVDVIENQTLSVPGSIQTYSLRAQNPRGPFGQPTLSLISDQFPTGTSQVAVTSQVSSDFHLASPPWWYPARSPLRRRSRSTRGSRFGFVVPRVTVPTGRPWLLTRRSSQEPTSPNQPLISERQWHQSCVR
jgi:hypothetical protein